MEHTTVAVHLCAKWPLLCEAILLCHLINMAAIFIIPGRDCGANCKFPTRADQYSVYTVMQQ